VAKKKKPKKKRKKKTKADEPIKLYPMTLEEALKKALETELSEEKNKD